MTRAALFAVLVTTAAGLARAEVPEAPPPRPAGVKPRPPVPKAADPAATVEKIIQNTKATADRLAKADTGTDTRKLQDETLALIDSLLDQSGNPPPRPDQNQNPNPEPEPGQKKDPDQKSDPKQQDMNTGERPQEKGKNADPKDRKQDGKADKKPGDGGKGGKKEQGPKGEPEKGGDQPMTGAAGPKGMETESGAKTGPGPKQEPMPGGGRAKKDGKGPKDDPKAGMGGGVAGKQPPGTVPPRPSLLIDEEVAKQVWGHLREKERQQAMQWFHERYMPKYEDLMNLYFSSLGDRRPVAEQRK